MHTNISKNLTAANLFSTTAYHSLGAAAAAGSSSCLPHGYPAHLTSPFASLSPAALCHLDRWSHLLHSGSHPLTFDPSSLQHRPTTWPQCMHSIGSLSAYQLGSLQLTPALTPTLTPTYPAISACSTLGEAVLGSAQRSAPLPSPPMAHSGATSSNGRDLSKGQGHHGQGLKSDRKN